MINYGDAMVLIDDPLELTDAMMSTDELNKAIKRQFGFGYSIYDRVAPPISMRMPAKQITMEIKKVIFNNPATIVIWEDDTKTVVKCGKDDIYDPEKGLAMAIAKRVYSNKGKYYEVFKKWLPKEENTVPEYLKKIEEAGRNFQIGFRDAFNRIK